MYVKADNNVEIKLDKSYNLIILYSIVKAGTGKTDYYI